MDSDGWFGLIFWTITAITFSLFSYLGIKYNWDFWFLISIGLQILTWIAFAILYSLGEDGGFFYFSTLFKNLGIITFLTLFFGVFFGIYALWIPPIAICIILFGTRTSSKPWSD
jgi:hypothetical protein